MFGTMSAVPSAPAHAVKQQRTWRGRGLALPIVHYGLRAVLGLVLALAVIGKVLDLPGFRDVLRTYDLFPEWSLWPLAVLMPLIEGVIAVTVLTGCRLREGIWASVALHTVFAVILVVELLRGVYLPNCGCFGVFHARPLQWYTPLLDLQMVTITLIIAATARNAQRGRDFRSRGVKR